MMDDEKHGKKLSSIVIQLDDVADVMPVELLDHDTYLKMNRLDRKRLLHFQSQFIYWLGRMYRSEYDSSDYWKAYNKMDEAKINLMSIMNMVKMDLS